MHSTIYGSRLLTVLELEQACRGMPQMRLLSSTDVSPIVLGLEPICKRMQQMKLLGSADCKYMQQTMLLYKLSRF